MVTSCLSLFVKQCGVALKYEKWSSLKSLPFLVRSSLISEYQIEEINLIKTCISWGSITIETYVQRFLGNEIFSTKLNFFYFGNRYVSSSLSRYCMKQENWLEWQIKYIFKQWNYYNFY